MAHDGKNWTRRLALGGGAAAAAALGYFALRPGQGTGPRITLDPTTFHRGNAAEPDTLDPSQIQGTWEDQILGDLLVGLTTADAKDEPIPGMATSWETTPDGLVWTFHLREALWSDGEKVTAEDFVFSWRHTLDPKTAAPYAYFLYPIKNAQTVNAGKAPPDTLGARAVDPLTLQVTLEHPVPYMVHMLMHHTFYPQPRHVVTAKGKEWTRPGNFVGNGAFVLKEWVPNSQVVVEKNPRFYDADNVKLQRVIFYPSTDYSAALRSLRAGELDVQDRYPGGQLAWIKQNMPELLAPLPQMTAEFISINFKRKPLDDVRVRAAISLTVNREMDVQRIRRGGEQEAYNIVPPGTANYPGGVFLPFKDTPYEQRLAQAQRLMQEAGFGPDNRIKLTYAIRSTAPGVYRAEAAAFQQALALIYINITILPFDAAIFYNTVQEHDYDLAQVGWAADFDDAATFLELFVTGGANNYGEYASKIFDAMLAASRQDVDVDVRGKRLAEAEAILLKDHVFVPIFFWTNTNMVRPYVKGWEANKMDTHRDRWVSIDAEEQKATFAGGAK